MTISVGHSILIIALCAIITFAERLFPFVIFRKRRVPPVIRYLGNILPPAVIAALVVYCLRYTDFTVSSDWVPAISATAVTALLHLWRRSTLLSVLGGTVCYMLLVQLVF